MPSGLPTFCPQPATIRRLLTPLTMIEEAPISGDLEGDEPFYKEPVADSNPTGAPLHHALGRIAGLQPTTPPVRRSLRRPQAQRKRLVGTSGWSIDALAFDGGEWLSVQHEQD